MAFIVGFKFSFNGSRVEKVSRTKAISSAVDMTSGLGYDAESTESEKGKVAVLILGIIVLILGTLSIMSPLVAGTAVATLVGVLLVAAGITRVLWAFKAETFGRGALAFLLGLRLPQVLGLHCTLHRILFLPKTLHQEKQRMYMCTQGRRMLVWVQLPLQLAQPLPSLAVSRVVKLSQLLTQELETGGYPLLGFSFCSLLQKDLQTC